MVNARLSSPSCVRGQQWPKTGKSSGIHPGKAPWSRSTSRRPRTKALPFRSHPPRLPPAGVSPPASKRELPMPTRGPGRARRKRRSATHHPPEPGTKPPRIERIRGRIGAMPGSARRCWGHAGLPSDQDRRRCPHPTRGEESSSTFLRAPTCFRHGLPAGQGVNSGGCDITQETYEPFLLGAGEACTINFGEKKNSSAGGFACFPELTIAVGF